MVFKRFLGVLTSPFKTFEEIAEERPVIQSAWMIIAAFVSWSWGLKYAHNHGAGKIAEFLSSYSPLHALVVGSVFRLNYLFVLILFALWALGSGFIRAAILQLSAEILGGKGRGFSLLSNFGYAHVPLVFIFPLALISSLIGQGDLGSGAGGVLWYSLAMLLHLWTIYVIILCIRATHQMEFLDALKVIIYPLAAFLIIALLAKVLIVLSGSNFTDLIRVGQGG
jgi:hypothetical protein